MNQNYQILADYDPATHRKDTFNLSLKRTKSQMKELDSKPFFAFYNSKYGKSLAPIFIVSKFLTKILPELQVYKPSRITVQQKLLAKNSVFDVRVKRENDKYRFHCGLVQGNLKQLLQGCLAIPEAAFTAVFGDNGEMLPGLLDRAKTAIYDASGYNTYLSFPGSELPFENEKEKLCLQSLASVSMVRHNPNDPNSTLTFVCEFNITKEECEQLTQLPFVAVRDIDIYPLLTAWARSGYEEGPTTAIAVSRISSALSTVHTQYAKTNEHGLMLTAKGEIIYMFREVNNARKYEDAYAAFCNPTSPDGYFGLNNGLKKTDIKLPVNLPVLVDWTNGVFTYSNSNGSLATLDLTQARPLTPSHVRNVFRRLHINPKSTVGNFEYWAVQCGIDISQYLPPQYSTYQRYIEFLSHELPKEQHFSFIDAAGGDEQWDCVYKAIKATAEAMEKQIDVLCTKFSVITIIRALGVLKAISVYGGPNWQSTVEADEQSRTACIQQGVNPDWEMPAVSLWNDNCGLMPHQHRVMNMLKDTPAHAMIPVAAGGGKTIISIMDVLSMFNRGVNAPYMILCPSTLVSQYVQEISYFTNARLNAIPITTSVVKREGLGRLQKIFEAAPRNTVVVCSYDALKYNNHTIAYGTSSVTIYPVVNFLRQFGFQYALCDESHQLKKETSIRSKAVRMLLTDIPNVRLASGTLAFNRIDDLVGQTAIMDPSVFGTQEDFRAEYGLFDTRGNFLGLRPQSEALVNSTLKANLVMARASRQEWAAILPQPVHNYHLVDLSAEERELYDTVLNDAVDAIQSSPKMQRALDRIQKLREKAGSDEVSEERVEQLEEALTKQLGPYLQRLERLIVDPLAETGLIDTTTDANYLSEKIKCIIDIVEKNHLGNNIPGKVLIFTENNKSAEWIYEGFQKHSSIGKKGLLYKASDKAQLLDKFNKDPDIVWMVGVETSLNTGLNLQAASRIIRAEYPWQPGAIEQGNARILRPLFKSADNRTKVYFDWVICEGTIDTLKISRLMSKSAEISKFENPNNPEYEAIGQQVDPMTNEVRTSIPMLRISLGTIRKKLRFIDEDETNGELMPYLDAMKDIDRLTKKSYQEYREQHQDEWDPETGKMKQIDVPVNQNPKDAKLLKLVPYVEGTNLYKADQLGLQRLDEYLNAVKDPTLSGSDDDEEAMTNESSSDDDTDTDDYVNSVVAELKHETCWTEYGECSIYSITKNLTYTRVRVGNTTDTVRLPTSSVFIITKKNVKPKELQESLLKSIGLSGTATPENVRPVGFRTIKKGLKHLQKIDREKLKEQQEEQRNTNNQLADLSIELKPIIINGVLGLQFPLIEKHELAINVLQQNGFAQVPEYWRAQIKDYNALARWLVKMEQLGLKFKRPYDYSGAWVEISKLLKRHLAKHADDGKEFRARSAILTRVVSTGGLQTMLKWNIKPSADDTLLRVMPMFNNGKVEAVMPADSVYRVGRLIRQKRTIGIKWIKGTPAFECYFTSPQEAIALLNKMQADGLNIVNLKHLTEVLTKVRRSKFADAEKIKKESAKNERARRVTLKQFGWEPSDEISIVGDLPATKRKSLRRRRL